MKTQFGNKEKKMNPRIKELAEQCWNKRPEGQLHFDNEKFAELIVKECADQVSRKSEAISILEYFGVK